MAERSASSTTRSLAGNDLKGRTRLVVIAIASGAAAAVLATTIATAGSPTTRAWSLSTAYIAFFFLALSMVLGPLNLVRRRRNPVHSALRRDVGVAGGAAAIVHTAIGFQVHMGGSIPRYFQLRSPVSSSGVLFVATNSLGLVSCAILAVLVTISTDLGIRQLGLQRWKRIQRLAYWAVAAAILHGLIYQLLEKRSFLLVLLLVATTIAIVAIQLKGSRLKRAEMMRASPSAVVDRR